MHNINGKVFAEFEPVDGLSLSGYLSTINSVKWGGIDHDYEAALIRQRFSLSGSYSHELFTAVLDLDFISDMPWDSDNLSFILGEAYFEFYVWQFTLSAGQRKLSWTKSFYDIFGIGSINPSDYSNFLLTDEDEIRLAVPMIKADWELEPFSVELVWMPVSVSSTLPRSDSIWYVDPLHIVDYRAFPVLPALTVNDTVYPDKKLYNSECAARLKVVLWDIELAMIYGYLYDNYPVIQSRITEFDIDTDSLSMEITPAYKRFHQAMFTIERKVWDILLHGEAAFIYRKSFNYVPDINTDFPADIESDVNDYNDHKGCLEKYVYKYLVSVSYEHEDWISADAMFLSEIIPLYDTRIIQDRYTFYLFSRVRYSLVDYGIDFRQENLWNIGYSSAMLRLAVDYRLIDSLQISGMFDFYVGDYNSVPGYYWKNDCLTLKIKYSF